jgi:hypothetical protein
MKSRERLTDVLLSFDDGAVIYGYRTDGNAIEFFGANGERLTPSYAAVGSGYERASGKFKSTTRVDVDPNQISGNVPEWVSRYDRVYAVDTNTIELDGISLCITCCVRAEITFDGPKWSGNVELLDALVVWKPALKPELIGWLDVLDRINTHPSLRVGLVVDSELAMLPQFNLRNVPIVDGIYLPTNVQLVYASADQDKNLPFNYLIAKCDSDATFLINKIKQDRSRLAGLRASNGRYYESSYYWPPKRAKEA